MGVAALTPRRAVFFDRDGVLNKPIVREGQAYPPSSLAALRLQDGAEEALRRLVRCVPSLFVVSNQPDVSRGTQTRAEVEAINAELARRLPIAQFYVCYHDDADRCDCRKPLPGLLLRAAREHGVDLRRSYMVGDRWRDIDAGAAVGCTTILLQQGYDERPPNTPPAVTVSTLTQAVDAILRLEACPNGSTGIGATA
jgi:D-glycero-D-manno-heptose 1,7-bisphosphate phosphatase